MIKYTQKNEFDINLRRITLFWFLDLSFYVDSNVGKHYGISIGVKTRQIHLIMRNWEELKIDSSKRNDA
jgi:hypothetical protein